MTCACVSTAPAGTLKRVDVRGCGSGPWQTGSRSVANDFGSSIGGQLAAFGFRKQQCGDDDDAIGDEREHADRMAERQLGAQQTDKERIEGGDASSKIIGEALPRSAYAGGEAFRQERAHTGEYPRGEEPEREAENEHDRVVHWDLRIDEHRDQRTDGEEYEVWT